MHGLARRRNPGLIDSVQNVMVHGNTADTKTAVSGKGCCTSHKLLADRLERHGIRREGA